MKNKKIFLILIFAVTLIANFEFCLSPALAQVATPEPSWQGLVPCGRNSGTPAEQAPCTLCHLVVGFQRLVQYGLYMVVTLALVGIFFAGVMYMVSSGDENMMTQAKGFLKASLIGFAVVICGWLMVNVAMWVLGAKEGSDEGGVLGINVVSWNKFTCDAGVGGNLLSTTPSVTSVIGPSVPAVATPSVVSDDAVINLSPSSLSFSKTGVGSASDPQTITITNTGSGSLKVESIQFSGTNSSSFTQTNTCESELTKDNTCTILITFKPDVYGEMSAAVEISSNATEKIKTVKLSGVSGEKQCELIAGNAGADFVFMLVRSKFGVPSAGMKQGDCSDAVDWDKTKQSDLSDFKTMASKMASGLDLIEPASKSYFAVYRLDEVYDGANESILQDIINSDCPEASNKRLFNYGYVYNGGGEKEGGMGSGRAYAINSTKQAFYCIKNDPDNNKTFAHEQIGHIFGKLEDEYLTRTCLESAFWYHNVTKDISCAKWQNIAASPNCYSGCNCKSGKNSCFRSTFNSIMREHWEADGIFNVVQNYIISGCAKNFTVCPPVSMLE